MDEPRTCVRCAQFVLQSQTMARESLGERTSERSRSIRDAACAFAVGEPFRSGDKTLLDDGDLAHRACELTPRSLLHLLAQPKQTRQPETEPTHGPVYRPWHGILWSRTAGNSAAQIPAIVCMRFCVSAGRRDEAPWYSNSSICGRRAIAWSSSGSPPFL